MAKSRTQLLAYFRLQGESLSAFAAELKKLSEAEKDELARGVAALQGEDYTPPPPADR